MKEDKSNWSVNYEKTHPVITLTDCNGKIDKFDINNIVDIEKGKIAMRILKIIEGILDIKESSK